jgi:hypothetical protein
MIQCIQLTIFVQDLKDLLAYVILMVTRYMHMNWYINNNGMLQ